MMDEEASTSGGVSRRRLAFRPPIAAVKSTLTNDESQAAMVLATMDTTMIVNNSAPIITPIPSTSGSSDDMPSNTDILIVTDVDVRNDDHHGGRKKVAKSWTHDDIMAYYEALKLHGKDFDSVAKVLSKRKVMKDKDQIKNYFYNSLKIIKQLLSIDEDDIGDVQKDAKELFLVLNACEWKKRTNNGKFISDRLKELLFEGMTTVRINKKSVQIKTPPCPSLCKWFTRSRRIEKVPSDIIFCLKPLSNGDNAFMRSNCLNPLLKVKMNTNEKFSKLVEMLQKKWTRKDPKIRVRLWPSFETEVGRLQVVETDISPFNTLSLNKLRKETEAVREEKKASVPNTGCGVTAKESIRVRPTYNVLYPKPFSLTDEIMQQGICVQNVGNIGVAELYSTCGMTEVIELRYEIEMERLEVRLEPWKVMMDLVTRDYGEAICAPQIPPSTLIRTIPEDSIMFRRKESMTIEDTSSNGSIEAPAVVEPPAPKKPRVQVQIPDIVQAENDAFKSQLLGLKRAKTARKKPVKSPAIPASQTPNRIICSTPVPPTIPEVLAAPITCQVIPKAAEKQQKAPEIRRIVGEIRETAKKAANQSPRTDFSDILLSPIKSESRQMRLNEQFLGSLKTPIKTPKKMTSAELFGDISMSPSMSRKNATIMSNPDDEQSRCELTDLLFGEISSTPTKYMSQNAPSSSNNNPSTSLGFTATEVQQSYVDMITSSQDSRDFVLQQFKQEKNCKKRL